jgi:hypothetical protein
VQEKQLRRVIRHIILETYTSGRQKKDYHNALVRGLKIGRGEKVASLKKQSARENYFSTRPDDDDLREFLIYYNDIKSIHKNIDPTRLDSNTKISSIVNKFNYFLAGKLDYDKMFEWCRKYKDVVKREYKSLPSGIQNRTYSCMNYFLRFIAKVDDKKLYDFDWIASINN